MRAKTEYPAVHGAQNAIDGSDPVPPGVWFTPVLVNGFGFLRFRRTNENDVQFEADLVDLNPGDVVATIDAPYRPAQDAYGVGKYGPDDSTPGVCVWKLQTNGDLVFVGAVVSSGPGTDTTAIHWGANTDPTGSGVTLSDLGSLNLILLSSNFFQIYDSTGGTVRLLVGEDGTFVFGLGTGTTYTVVDSSNNPMLQMTEGSPDLHLPTGGNVIFDL